MANIGLIRSKQHSGELLLGLSTILETCNDENRNEDNTKKDQIENFCAEENESEKVTNANETEDKIMNSNGFSLNDKYDMLLVHNRWKFEFEIKI